MKLPVCQIHTLSTPHHNTPSNSPSHLTAPLHTHLTPYPPSGHPPGLPSKSSLSMPLQHHLNKHPTPITHHSPLYSFFPSGYLCGLFLSTSNLHSSSTTFVNPYMYASGMRTLVIHFSAIMSSFKFQSSSLSYEFLNKPLRSPTLSIYTIHVSSPSNSPSLHHSRIPC